MYTFVIIISVISDKINWFLSSEVREMQLKCHKNRLYIYRILHTQPRDSWYVFSISVAGFLKCNKKNSTATFLSFQKTKKGNFTCMITIHRVSRYHSNHIHVPVKAVTFLAHLSWSPKARLRQASVVRSSVVVCVSTFSNLFSTETAGPIEAKFYVKRPWDGGTNFVQMVQDGHCAHIW